MAVGRFRDAVSDMAETIRRVFKDPPAHGVRVELPAPVGRSVPFPATQASRPPFQLVAVPRGVPTLEPHPPRGESFAWEARLLAEEGLARWDAGAQVCVLPLFQAQGCSRLEVPPLPRRPKVLEGETGAFRTRGRSGLEGLPGTRACSLEVLLQPPRAHRDLETALALPVAFQGEDIPRIPKAIWMRYTLKMVRETGENIRNLEVLGLYRIPQRGTRSINHQASTGRLLVTLGPDAAGARRAPFIIARKKDDGSMVCCFVEEP